jgi:LCP family protein required for cell wall assembly
MSTTLPPQPPRAPAPGAPALDPIPAEPPRRPWWFARRVLAAAIGIVLISGGASAYFALDEVSKVVEALRESKPVELRPDTLAPTSKGGPETLLLVGNDERPPPKSNPNGAVEPHSNEMLLVRVDPSKPTISMLSIPRELQVTFTAPNGQVITNRINSAYTYGYEENGGTGGGVQLMLETIKRVLGVTVNHVFVTNFPKFKRAVDEMGCVYMMVDRRYYHVNEPGGEQYFEINLQPGYQLLCGKQALEFVANRHEDTSLTRDARDQRFLLSVKNQYGPEALENREKFERIFGKAVETDTALHGTDQVLGLLELLAESAGKPVRQVPFHVNLLPTYDTASHQAIAEAVSSFMSGTAAIHQQPPTPARRAGKHAGHGQAHHEASSAATLGMTAMADTTVDEARSMAPLLPFQLMVPQYEFTSAAAGADLLRRYDIHGPDRRLYPAYVLVVDRGGLGEFYDVQGTTWRTPPLLGTPSASVQAGSRTYDLYYDGEHIKTVAWHEDGAVYWVENTLTNGLSPHDMVAVAQETVPIISAQSSSTANQPTVISIRIPSRSAASTSSVAGKAGALLALAVLFILAGLTAFVLSRQREVRELRTQVAVALAHEARQRAALGVAGTTPGLRASRAPTGTTPPPDPEQPSAAARQPPPGAPSE